MRILDFLLSGHPVTQMILSTKMWNEELQTPNFTPWWQVALNIFLQNEKKFCKKAKWLSEEALQIAEERREVKGKGEKGRYTHLNAEFQRVARRDKKAFLSDQCKEIEENNRMGKTTDLLKNLALPREHFMQRWAQ